MQYEWLPLLTVRLNFAEISKMFTKYSDPDKSLNDAKTFKSKAL